MFRILVDQPYDGEKRYIEAAGLSTDEKPSEDIITGSSFLEVDTGDAYLYDEVGQMWSKIGGTS